MDNPPAARRRVDDGRVAFYWQQTGRQGCVVVTDGAAILLQDELGSDAARAGDGADEGFVVGLVGDAEAAIVERIRADERAGSGRAGDVEFFGEVGAADFEDLDASGPGDVEGLAWGVVVPMPTLPFSISMQCSQSEPSLFACTNPNLLGVRTSFVFPLKLGPGTVFGSTKIAM